MSLTESNLAAQGEPSDPHETTEDQQGKVVESQSPYRLAWDRFKKDKLSMAALTVTVLFLLVAILSPILVALDVLDPFTNNPSLVDPNTGGLPIGKFGGITWSHPFGVEPGIGRDVMSRLALGATISLSISLIAAILTVIFGTIVGIISGFAGGIVDGVMGRIIDLVLCFPQTLMLLALSQVVVDRMSTGFSFFGLFRLSVPDGPNNAVVNGTYIIVVLAAFGWPPVARLIRGQVLTIREREFVDAAILMGASRRRIYFKEILPNLWAPLLVYFTLLMPVYVSAEAALSFLGVGIKNPTPTLGNVLSDALTYSSGDFVYFFVPAAIIAAIVVSFNLLGDGARDALDPKSR